MGGAQFQIPLITVIPGQLITAALWNNEWNNISVNLNPSGIDGYMDTTTQAQIQTAPYPGSVLSLATNSGGEFERIRYQISAILGMTTPPYWYAAPPDTLTNIVGYSIPLGGVFDYHSQTSPTPNFLWANGQAISRVTYVNLFNLYNALTPTPLPFGSGDGSTTFNIPNYTDKMSIAAGNLYALAGTGGSTAGPLSITDPGHTHTQNAHTHTDSGHTHTTPNHVHTLATSAVTANTSGGTAYVNTDGSGRLITFSGVSNTANIPTSTTTSGGAGTSGSGTANNQNTTATENSQTTGISGTAATLPPYLGMYKMIRVI